MDHMWMARAHALAKAAPKKLGARLGGCEISKSELKQNLATEPDVTYQTMSLDDAIQKLFDLERAFEGKLAGLQARLTSLEMGGSQAGMGLLQAKIASLEAKVMENSDNIIQLDKNQKQSMQNCKQSDMHAFRVCPINQ